MDIKFQFLYKGLPFSSKTTDCNWHKKVYTLDQLIEKPLSQLSDAHDTCELIAKRQWTGLQDRNGVDIYVGDILGGVIVAEVHWCRDGLTYAFKFGGECSCFSCSGDAQLNEYEEHELEVIGNIYQNGNLLK